MSCGQCIIPVCGPFGAFPSVIIIPVAYTSAQVALEIVRGVARGKDIGVLATNAGGMYSGQSINDLPVDNGPP